MQNTPKLTRQQRRAAARKMAPRHAAAMLRQGGCCAACGVRFCEVHARGYALETPAGIVRAVVCFECLHDPAAMLAIAAGAR